MSLCNKRGESMLHLSVFHWVGIIAAVAAVFIGVFAAGKQRGNVDGFSVGGRAASIWLVAGALIGTIIGASSTIGTTQAAVSIGFSAWWFTVGSTLGLIILGAVYAGPLRRSGFTTIAEFLTAKYGPAMGIAASATSVLGIFFSLVASGLAGVHFMQVIFPVSEIVATFILLAAVVVYVLAGGIKGTAISGIIKTLLLYFCLFIGGWFAFGEIRGVETATGPLLSQRFLYPHGWEGWSDFATNCLSVIIGIVVTQSYAQAIYSAADTKKAIQGCYLGAVCCLPIGLPLIAIGLYMGHFHPDIPAVTALPSFMELHMHPLLGGLGLGAILLSIIGSVAGLSLGAATSVAVDIFEHGFGIHKQRHVFLILQASLIIVVLGAFMFSLFFYDSQILYWNFLSFSLRGAGLFFPFLLAVLGKEFSSSRSVTANVLVSTAVAIASIDSDFIHLNPLYVGMGFSLCWLIVEYIYLHFKKA